MAKKLIIPQNFLQSLTVLGVSKALMASHLSFITVKEGFPPSIRNLYPIDVTVVLGIRVVPTFFFTVPVSMTHWYGSRTTH